MCACLDHDCRECGYWWADNSPSRVCPRCAGTNTSVYFDEYEDHCEEDPDCEPDEERGYDDG